MRSNWRAYPLGEITELVIDYRGKTPKKLGGDWSESGYRALSAKNIKTGHIVQPDTIRFVSEEMYHKWMKDEIQRGDIIITSEAPFGQILYWDSEEKIVLSQRLFGVRVKEEHDSKFVYYYMTTSDFQGEMDGRATGTTVVGLRQPELMKCVVRCPDLDTQKKIASILSSIDEKILINDKINENLEQQVQTLFADWLSANSESATEIALGNICTKVTDGSHFSPKDDSTSSIPMLSVKDMREFDFDLTSCKHICEDDYEKMIANDCVPQVNDILVAKDGSYLKEIFICNEKRKLAILSSIAIFRPNTTVIHPEILLAFLKSPRVLQEVRDNYVSGSALPRIVLKDFKKLTFSLPDMDAQNLIAPLFASIREQIAVNVAENKYMTQLRDTLLPKLMSGELNVDNIHF